jgi:hypothetical protein
MRGLFIGLAFCSCAYTWLGCLAQWFAGPEISGGLPPEILAFRILAFVATLCCICSLFEALPAAVAAWISALIYLGISWKFNAGWVFHADLWFTLWTPIFLSIAALLRKTVPRSSP